MNLSFENYINYRIRAIAHFIEPKILVNNDGSFKVDHSQNSIWNLAKTYHKGDKVKHIEATYMLLPYDKYMSGRIGPLNYILYYEFEGEVKSISSFVNGIDRTKNHFYKDRWIYYLEFYQYKGVIIQVEKEAKNTRMIKIMPKLKTMHTYNY